MAIIAVRLLQASGAERSPSRPTRLSDAAMPLSADAASLGPLVSVTLERRTASASPPARLGPTKTMTPRASEKSNRSRPETP
ncbi:MAG: hypothetical protein CISAcid_05990 [uncultured Acidilobus sp. CIS]|jgi:hypothetical protein|nr:MAG: hypothetical protein CISAcid_05990 [uncultured Acidilobus sp. CIS]